MNYGHGRQGRGATRIAQIINYLELSRLPAGYFLNFANTRVEWKRIVNQRD